VFEKLKFFSIFIFSGKTDFTTHNGSSDARKLSIGPYLEIESSTVFSQNHDRNLKKDGVIIENKSISSVNTSLEAINDVDVEKLNKNGTRKESLESSSSKTSTRSRPRSYTNADETSDLIPEGPPETQGPLDEDHVSNFDEISEMEDKENFQNTRPVIDVNSNERDLSDHREESGHSSPIQAPETNIETESLQTDNTKSPDFDILETEKVPISGDEDEKELSDQKKAEEESGHFSPIQAPESNVETESLQADNTKSPDFDISEIEKVPISGDEAEKELSDQKQDVEESVHSSPLQAPETKETESVRADNIKSPDFDFSETEKVPISGDEDEKELSDQEQDGESGHSSPLKVPVINIETLQIDNTNSMNSEISDSEKVPTSGDEDSIDIAQSEIYENKIRHADIEEDVLPIAVSSIILQASKPDTLPTPESESETIRSNHVDGDLTSNLKVEQEDNLPVFQENEASSSQTDTTVLKPSPAKNDKAKLKTVTRLRASSADAPAPPLSRDLSPRISRRSNAVRRRSGKNTSVSSEDGLLELDVQFKRKSCMPRESVASLTEFFESKTNMQLEQAKKVCGSTS